MALPIKNIEDRWFQLIVDGHKTFEGRPNVGFWHDLNVGDRFIFLRQAGNTGDRRTDGPLNPNKMEVEVTKIIFYENFADACLDLGTKLIPNATTEEAIAVYKDLEKRYDWTIHLEKYGVIAIGLQVICLVK